MEYLYKIYIIFHSTNRYTETIELPKFKINEDRFCFSIEDFFSVFLPISQLTSRHHIIMSRDIVM